MKRILFFLIAIIFAISAQSQSEIIVGSGGTGNALSPINYYYSYSYSQMLYDQSSLVPGTISAIKFKYSSATGVLADPVVVYMKNTTKTSFATTADFDSVGLVQVFSGSVTSATGWVTIQLSTPFVYDGTGSLLIAIDNNTGVDNGGSTSYWNNSPTTDYKTINAYSDTYNTDPLSPNGNSASKARLQYLPVLSVIITPDDPNVCFSPSNFNYSNVVSDGVQLSWDLDANVSSYSIDFKTSAQTWAEATTVSGITGTTYSITNLVSNTNYNVRITPECVTALSSSLNFRTSCGVISEFPWIEGFEETWNTAAVAPGNKVAPSCWLNIDSLNTASYYWQTISTAKYGSKAAYMYGAGFASTNATATYQNNDWLVSPVLSLTGGERLNFWSKKSSTSYYPDLLIYAMDVSAGDLDATSSNANFVLVGSVDTLLLTTTYAQFEFDLSSLVGDHRLAFVRKKTASGSVYIDEVKVSALPTCFTPTDLVISNIGSDEVDLSWTPAIAGDNAWILTVKNIAANTIETISASSSTHTLTNLIPNSNYSISIMTDCGSGAFSDATDPITFKTNCASEAIPYLEEFTTSVTSEPTCWTRMTGLLVDNSIITPTTGGWSHTTQLGGAMRYNLYGLDKNYWLISPSIDLGDGSIDYQLELDVVLSAYSGAPTSTPTYDNDDVFAVVVSTDNGTTWLKTNARIWNNADLDIDRNFSDFGVSPTHLVIKLEDDSQIPYTGDVKIGFYLESTASGADNYIYIDNVSVIEAPQCPNVFNVTVANATFTSIDVNFSTDNAAPGVGWEIAYDQTDAASFDPNSATILPIYDATTVPYTITGLIEGSQYSFAVRQDCGGDWSPTVTLATFALPAQVPYNCDFENLTENIAWMLSNTTTDNKWFIGDAVNSGLITGNSLYVTNDNGITNEYTHAANVIVASRLIEFDGSDAYLLSFNSRVGGESLYDYLKVYLVDMDTTYLGTASTPYYGSNSYSQGVVLFNGTNPYYNRPLNATDINNHIIEIPSQGQAGTVKKLVFVWKNDGSGGTQPAASIDNISITALNCPSPELTSSNPTPNSIDLSWNTSSSDIGWKIYWKEAAADLDYDSIYTSAFPPYVLSGLTQNTAYSIYVKSDCGTEYSNPSNTINVQTQCEAITTLPWTEGFESITIANEMPSCMAWTGTTGKVKTYIAAGDHNLSARTGDKYMAFIWGCDNYVYTPGFDLQAGVDYNFSFWYKSDGATGFGPLKAELMSEQAPTGVISAIGTPVLANIQNTTFEQYQGVFTPDTDGVYYVGIHLAATGTSPWNVVIDDLSLEIDGATPPCIEPTTLTVTNITTTTADISWTSTGTETAWQVREGLTGTETDVTSTTYMATGLTPDSPYTFYVRSDCGAGLYSEWVSVSFTTPSIVVTPPTVVTSAATTITETLATLNGTITAGTETITAQGFEWKETSATTWTIVSEAGTAITHNLTGLTANTAYEFRVFATTAAGDFYGLTEAFTTLATSVATPPTVVTSPATSITQTIATLNGTITAGTETITAQGFEWKETSATTWTIVSEAGAAINHNLTGLTANTAYQFRAFATTATGDVYGLTEAFTTLATAVTPPTVVTNAATLTSGSSATLNGTITAGSEAITTQGFEWKQSSASAWIVENSSVFVGNAISYELLGLAQNTAYEFRIFAVTASATTYGETKNFTTLGLNGVDEKEISIMMYPNPATSQTNLIVNGVNGETKIVLSDVQGRVLNTINTKPTSGVIEQTINLNNLAKGIYYIRIQNSDISRTQKLIVK